MEVAQSSAKSFHSPHDGLGAVLSAAAGGSPCFRKTWKSRVNAAI